MSQQSSWDGEAHGGPHFVLTIFPGGKLVLTTPSEVPDDQFERISRIFANWLKSEDTYPLIIGDCVVQMMTIGAKEVFIERA